MSESEAEYSQKDQKKQWGNNIALQSKVHLFFLGLLSISFVGYFALREHWTSIIFGHTAALSIMVFYGSLAGDLAGAKGYSYVRAFQLGFFLPIILGVIGAFTFLPPGKRDLPLTCGGWVSLAAGLVVVVFYAIIKKRDRGKQIATC